MEYFCTEVCVYYVESRDVRIVYVWKLGRDWYKDFIQNSELMLEMHLFFLWEEPANNSVHFVSLPRKNAKKGDLSYYKCKTVQ